MGGSEGKGLGARGSSTKIRGVPPPLGDGPSQVLLPFSPFLSTWGSLSCVVWLFQIWGLFSAAQLPWP